MFKRYLYLNYRAFSTFKYRLQHRVTASGWIVLGSTLIAAALGADTNASLAYQTFTFLFCLLVASAFLTRWSGCKRISAERILPRFGSAGERFFYSLLLRNNSSNIQKSLNVFEEMADPRPTFTEFSSTPELPNEKRTLLDRAYNYDWWTHLVSANTRAQIREQNLPDLPRGREENVRVELMPLRRGVLRFTGVSIAAPEPFGLFRSLPRHNPF